MAKTIFEECSSCKRILIFKTEEDRLAAMIAYAGEIFCERCKAKVIGNA